MQVTSDRSTPFDHRPEPLTGMPSLLRLPADAAHAARRGLRAAWRVLVEIGHNSLALLGLAALGVVIFFHNESPLRHEVERQMLDWLNLRHAPAETDSAVDVLADIAEPQAVARAAAAPLKALSRQQAAVAQWISRRYRVAPEPVARLVQEAWSIGRKAQLEPTVILALIAIESGFNPFAQSPVGAQGLMQVMTQVHGDKYRAFGGNLAAFDPITNLRVGVQVLLECMQRAGGSLEGGLKYYVGAANLPDDGGYAEKVMIENGFLKAVADGQNVPVTVAFNRPSAMTQLAPVDKPAVSTGVAIVDSIVAKVLPAAAPSAVTAPPPNHVPHAAAALPPPPAVPPAAPLSAAGPSAAVPAGTSSPASPSVAPGPVAHHITTTTHTAATAPTAVGPTAAALTPPVPSAASAPTTAAARTAGSHNASGATAPPSAAAASTAAPTAALAPTGAGAPSTAPIALPVTLPITTPPTAPPPATAPKATPAPGTGAAPSAPLGVAGQPAQTPSASEAEARSAPPSAKPAAAAGTAGNLALAEPAVR